MSETTPVSYSHLSADIRMEMLVGHLSDMLRPTRELAKAFCLQSNASVTTRGKLEHLIDLSGALWEELGRIREEVELIHRQLSGAA
jgi:hypothetical protein